MDSAIYDLGREEYRKAMGISDMDRDKNGFLVLKPTADRVDTRVEALTTDIGSLEEKLRRYRAEKAAAEKYKKTDEYKESKKKSKSSKKNKKGRSTLLEMVFNNADAAAAAPDEEEDEEGYKDLKKKGGSKSKKEKPATTLDTTYGMRFSPVVSMLYDTITDFDRIAAEIEEELANSRNTAKSMYRSSQIGNLITAKNSRLSAVKELGSIAKTVSDLEYKREKDKKDAEGSNTSKQISNLGARYLRGVFDLDDDRSSKSSKGDKDKKGKKEKKKEGPRGLDPKGDDWDDDDDSIDRGKRGVNSDLELAKEFAKTLGSRKSEMHFSPHERYVSIEGKYTFVVSVDPTDPEHTWKFLAVDPKTGKGIKGFKEDYKELYPKKKSCRMRFDLAKKKCTDLNSARSYKLVFQDS